MRRAELVRLRSGLNEQVRHLAQAFDDEIRESSTALLPDSNELREEGAAEAHRARYEQWAASHDRSLFARIRHRGAGAGTLTLYGLHEDGRMARMEWPPEWESLRVQMTARMERRGAAALCRRRFGPDSDSGTR